PESGEPKPGLWRRLDLGLPLCGLAPRVLFASRGRRRLRATVIAWAAKAVAASDWLFGPLPASIVALRWHDGAFELPTGAASLASSPKAEHQAFRYGGSFHGDAPSPGKANSSTARLPGWSRRAGGFMNARLLSVLVLAAGT